jgi:hypothetical protein
VARGSDRELEILHDMASERNRSKRKLYPGIALSSYHGHRCCLAGDMLQEKIQNWLSPPDPWKNYNIALESRHVDTGKWFIQSNTLSEWKCSGPSSLLWVHGKRQLQHIACAVT